MQLNSRLCKKMVPLLIRPRVTFASRPSGKCSRRCRAFCHRLDLPSEVIAAVISLAEVGDPLPLLVAAGCLLFALSPADLHCALQNSNPAPIKAFCQGTLGFDGPAIAALCQHCGYFKQGNSDGETAKADGQNQENENNSD